MLFLAKPYFIFKIPSEESVNKKMAFLVGEI
jgi:hypothetical protein